MTNEMMRIDEIIIRQSVNPRKKIRSDIVEKYSEIIDLLPPVIVQKSTGVLIDGFHRVAAAKHVGKYQFPAEEIDIPDTELFSEACRRNNAHGLPLSKSERNEAIVKLYREGWKQEALGELWGMSLGQINYIIGADKRTGKISPGEKGVKLTPKHEQIIRRAPEPIQDKIAEVVLTRETKPKEENDKPKKKILTVAQTNSLVKEAEENPEKIDETLDFLIDHPEEDNIVGIDDNGNIEESTLNQIIANIKANPGLEADWAELMLCVAEIKLKYKPNDLASYIGNDSEHGVRSLENAINYLETILVMIQGGLSDEV